MSRVLRSRSSLVSSLLFLFLFALPFVLGDLSLNVPDDLDLPAPPSPVDNLIQSVSDGSPSGEAEFVFRAPEVSAPGLHEIAPPPGVPAPPSSLPILLNVYRYGISKKVLLDSITKVSQLVKTAKELFADVKIERIVSRTGNPVTSMSSLKKLINGTNEVMLIALSKEEHFIWPALNVGDEVHLEVDGRPITVRTLATRPRIFEIDNLLEFDECDHIIKKAQTFGMMRSRVGISTDGAAPTAAFRTSSQLWVGPQTKNDDKVFLSIRKRVFNLTKLPNNLAEDTQVVFYDTNQHYYAHHDYTDKAMSPHDPYIQGGGNRLVTVLYYLNDVPDGGETAFPYVNSDLCPFTNPLKEKTKSCEQGLRIKPKKGGAAMFYSLQEEGHMDGNVDVHSLHAGCDVWKGEKWLANQWIRNKMVDGKIF